MVPLKKTSPLVRNLLKCYFSLGKTIFRLFWAPLNPKCICCRERPPPDPLTGRQVDPRGPSGAQSAPPSGANIALKGALWRGLWVLFWYFWKRGPRRGLLDGSIERYIYINTYGRTCIYIYNACLARPWLSASRPLPLKAVTPLAQLQ